MTHRELLNMWKSGYQMSQDTGIPWTTCKRWRSAGVISDWRSWQGILADAKYCRGLVGNTDATLLGLLKDRNT